jgi:hypothetical protein
MGVVSELYQVDSMDPGETFSLFIHGYGENDYADYAIIPTQHSNEPSGAYSILGAQLTMGPTTRHVDGTVARTIVFQNITVGPQAFISVRVLEFKQGL